MITYTIDTKTTRNMMVSALRLEGREKQLTAARYLRRARNHKAHDADPIQVAFWVRAAREMNHLGVHMRQRAKALETIEL